MYHLPRLLYHVMRVRRYLEQPDEIESCGIHLVHPLS